RRADELAMAAVAEPVSGTVLTVLHAAAQAAAAAPSDDLGDVASAATNAAAAALTETTRQLDVLAAAGVVDAGGQGLVVLLEALLMVVTECPDARLAGTAAVVSAGPPEVVQASRESGSTHYEYEVMYLLDSTDDASVATLRAELAGLGDCVAVVSSDQTPGGDAVRLWNVHVHCCDIGAVIEAGIRAGRPHRITVSRFADQASTDHAVLVMVSGCGLAEIFLGAGALTAPATSGVTELLAILTGTRAQHVTVLAGPAAAAIPVAEIAAAHARDSGQEVVVVPVVSPVQALAAVAVHDASRGAAADVMAMTEAATATRYGELTWVGRCQPGDVFGVIGNEVALIDRDPLAAARALVERMLSVGGELVTVLLGEQAPDGVEEMLIKHLRAAHPEVETMVYAGGPPDSMLLIGIE
ncbi:MAG: DAK2 domain-containing protein, partial [Actinomycetes bacterium]